MGNYEAVITIGGNEFGYFEYEDCFKAMVFNDTLKKQQVLFYEDSPGETMEGIERFIQSGFNFWGWEFEGQPEFKFKK